MGWFDSEGYKLVKDLTNAYNIIINDDEFSFKTGDGNNSVTIHGRKGYFSSDKTFLIIDGVNFNISKGEFDEINNWLISLISDAIKKKIGGYKLDDDIQKAINDTAKIQEAHAQIEFLTKEVNRIKSSYS